MRRNKGIGGKGFTGSNSTDSPDNAIRKESLTHPVPGRCATVNCYREPKGKALYCGTCRSRKCKRENVLKYTYQNLKDNASRRQIPFSLSLEEWEIWCGLTGYLDLRGVDGDSMTVDRIYDRDGLGKQMPYSYGNIQMITKTENCKKPKRYKKYEKQEGDPF